MPNRRRLALAALTATALSGFAAPASAQQVDRIVTFGDSYADDGNFFEILGINPATTTIYTSGRFSGTTNYVDTLSDILGVPVENFAIGGAMAQIFPGGASNTNCSGIPASCPLGLNYEVDQFFNVGTQSSAFPNSDTTFDEGDLLTVSIGGNDARFYQLTNPLSTTNAAAIAAAGSVTAATTQLDRLVAAGAPTISFLAGDTSRLPEITGNASAIAIRSAYSNAYNAGMQDTLAGYAADGVIVHYLDLNAVLDNIIASPAAYGITKGLVCPAFQPATPASPTCVLDSTGYLFYGDLVHLTGTGFAIVAQYVATQLTAPLTLQGASDLGMDVARQFGRTLTARLDLGSPRDGDMPEGFKFFLSGDSFSRSVNESSGNAPFDVNAIGFTAGAEYGFGSGVVGVAGNISRPELEFGGDVSEVEGESTQLGAYAGMGIAGGFIQGYLGFGWDDYDIGRRGVVEGMDANTDGDHFLAGAKAGYLFPVGGFRVGPVVALDYADVSVEGYTEEGDPALTLNVSDGDFNSLRGSIGIEARGDFAGDGVQWRPYGALTLEKELNGDDRSISFAQTSAPGIVNTWEIDDVSTKAYGRFTGGLNARILTNVELGAAISTTMGKKQGNETSGHLGVKVGF
ncbi:autotransporter domain-containing protein [Sphingomonas sp. HDW15A]|uniref:autotransporter domain-containing protein n=1 Tax=Sphingomonas sp. HDW15A TaxID=2714942 RepID=UPI00140B7AB0|nr:autotransporter domain-containing protein [Sphingomonas sp. HDW15A]QIK96720.1 autotransporter domain-containing protein [Sphingomonas sp. HDW15A]